MLDMKMHDHKTPHGRMHAHTLCMPWPSVRSLATACYARMLARRMQSTGRLIGLRVVCAGDMVPRIPFDVPFGCVHAISPRLLLQPGKRNQQISMGWQASATDSDMRWTRIDPQVLLPTIGGCSTVLTS